MPWDQQVAEPDHYPKAVLLTGTSLPQCFCRTTIDCTSVLLKTLRCRPA